MNIEHSRPSVLTALIVTLVLAGCVSAPERTLSQITPAYATLPNGNDPVHPDQPSPLLRSLTSAEGENFIRRIERKRGHALNLLSLSGAARTAPSVRASSLAGARVDVGPSSTSSVA